MRKLLLASALLAAACGHSATITTPSTPAPSPTPAPKLQVFIKVIALQNGQVVETVAADTDFKISASPTQCYIGGVETTCPSIPSWLQLQTGGPKCAQGGDTKGPAVLYNCHTVGEGLEFESCAQDFDGVSLGCGTWEILRVFGTPTDANGPQRTEP